METHDPEEDAIYLFNTNRHLPYEEQKFLAQNTLDFLNSYPATTQYLPFELTYMRGVWKRVLTKVEHHYGPYTKSN